MKLTYASVCSGIEAASVAWHPLGWRGAFVSEIEPFPCAVLAQRWPGVPNYGDMTKYGNWKSHTLDVLVGGTPCQAFSGAGLRRGLADPRGNLALTFLAVVDRYQPEWVLWENVPGVLSIDEGRTFGTFLGGLGKLGYGTAYRILDAQYYGVAQRRRRVFVVGHIGGLWQRAAAVLFERESLRGDSAPGREAGQGVAGTIAKCSFSGGAVGRPEVAPTLSARTGGGGSGTDFDCAGGLIPIQEIGKRQSSAQHGVAVPEVACALQERDSKGSDSNTKPGHIIPMSSGMAVRRLTPRECERLQGFPDDYTLIKYRGKLAADGPRFTALGNSMAVPVMRWIGQRIELVEKLKS